MSMRAATEQEYADASRRGYTSEMLSGKRYFSRVFKDRGTEVAAKHEIITRGKVVATSYTVNPDYLPGAEKGFKGLGKLGVQTDGKWHDFKGRHDVPEKVLASDFDWLDEDASDTFFKYRGTWYHTTQFMRGGVPGWDGHHSEGFSSAVLLRLSRDGEQYMVARYSS